MKSCIAPGLLPFVCLLLMLGAAGAWAQTDAAGATAPQSLRPAVAPPANARETDNSHQDFATYPLITDRIAQRGGINGNISATRTVEGALTQSTYQLSTDTPGTDIWRNYEQRLGTAGFDVLYQCEGDACGPTFLRASPGYRAAGSLFDRPLSAQHYIAAQRTDSGGDVYTSIQTADTDDGVVIQVDTLRVKPREISAISVNAEQMSQELNTKGRVALYGIFFNTDSAEIKPESKPTLNEIAKLLTDRPDLRLLVVGHTDSRGSFDYNIDLSTRRAKAVVDALVDEHDVDRSRLKPWGVGYTVPRASNDSDIGQAKNRRVELVVW
ncbi:OmpA family protein [Salinisphaera aquimarina]|uniref:OmpA family protein n=1 Tax=Salinisphaera aquimarina TaxID=2094031 RepID=A0ABV7ESK5_9GAMM